MTLVPVETLGKLLDLTPRRIQQLSNEGVIPKNDHGRYELVPAVQGYIRYLRGKRGESVGIEGYTEQRVRLTRSRAQILEMERERLAGDLIPKAQILETWEAVAFVIRTKLLAIPAKAAARLGMARNAVEAQAILKNEINEVLLDLSNVVVTDEADVASEPAPEPAGNGDGSIQSVQTAADSDFIPMG